MLQSLRIRNFKLHEDTTIQFGGLTILTGMNGMGKSTILQALLLLRQSFQSNRLKKSLNLRGDLVDLGVSGKLACQAVDSDEMKIDIWYDDVDKSFTFKYPDDVLETYLPYKHGSYVDADDIDNDVEESLFLMSKKSLFNENFQYISAFRFGPMPFYNRDSAVVSQDKQISKIQGKCEYTVHFLDQFKNLKILEELSLPDSANKFNYQLGNQVELWLQAISPRIHFKVERVGEDFKLSYRFDRENNFTTEEMSAINTGFGISYLLPILVGILSAKPGALILIENPEAHVHPKGQAILMELVAKAVKAGIQIVIETHSDHIVNGALVNVKRGILSNEDVKVYFFNRDEHLHIANTHKLEVTARGQILRPPKDFFDQMQIDLRVLTGIDK